MSKKATRQRTRPKKAAVAKFHVKIPVDAVEVVLDKPLSAPPVVVVTEKSVWLQFRESATGRFLLG